MKKRYKNIMLCMLMIMLFSAMAFTVISASAAESAVTGDIADVVEDTWTSAKDQIKQVVNNVVFPCVDMILAILFFVKLGTAYFDYRKHGQFEFAAPCILFACLVSTLTAPLYIWKIIG